MIPVTWYQGPHAPGQKTGMGSSLPEGGEGREALNSAVSWAISL